MYQKSTLNEETYPSSVDFRVQRYNYFLIYANNCVLFLVNFHNLAFYTTRDLVFLQWLHPLRLQSSNSLRGKCFDGYLHLAATYDGRIAVHILFQYIDVSTSPLVDGVEVNVCIHLAQAESLYLLITHVEDIQYL